MQRVSQRYSNSSISIRDGWASGLGTFFFPQNPTDESYWQEPISFFGRLSGFPTFSRRTTVSQKRFVARHQSHLSRTVKWSAQAVPQHANAHVAVIYFTIRFLHGSFSTTTTARYTRPRIDSGTTLIQTILKAVRALLWTLLSALFTGSDRISDRAAEPSLLTMSGAALAAW